MTKNAAVTLEVKETPVQPKSDTPWNYIHMDIQGPYNTSSGSNTFYATTLVDNFSGYAMTKPSLYCPNAAETVVLSGKYWASSTLVLRRFILTMVDSFARMSLSPCSLKVIAGVFCHRFTHLGAMGK